MTARERGMPEAELDLRLQRLLFLSDGVYAIAVILLAVELVLPEATADLHGGDLLRNREKYALRVSRRPAVTIAGHASRGAAHAESEAGSLRDPRLRLGEVQRLLPRRARRRARSERVRVVLP